ncbi:MAG: TIGR02449 family protein [Aquificaceae bacterium]|nr:MAG: TIGR02449 family protein [Aquificaceae bacterium]
MENYTTDARLKEQVAQLEETLTLLLSTTEKLFDENISLKEKEKQLLLERANLLSKNDKIRTQVEAMISRLKAMDKV